MTNHYIQALGVAKCREILKGAPDGAMLFYCFGKQFESRVDYYKYFYSYFQMWLKDHGWFPVSPDLADGACSLADLRAELSLHDTDNYTHLENHISPMTVVVG